jgi:hypothetical protein
MINGQVPRKYEDNISSVNEDLPTLTENTPDKPSPYQKESLQLKKQNS